MTAPKCEDDWNRDIRDVHEENGTLEEGEDAFMDCEHFIKSLHELVDLWTVTTNVEGI